MKVLVADDDPDQLAIRMAILRQFGWYAVAAADGPAVLEALENESFSCVVLDLSLPTPEIGLRLLRELRTKLPALPVFVLTGFPLDSEYVQEARQYAREVFLKGSGLSPLLARVKGLGTKVGSVGR